MPTPARSTASLIFIVPLSVISTVGSDYGRCTSVS
jgi:hypothetical protein